MLGRFSPATRAWFDQAFAATTAQVGAWDAIPRAPRARRRPHRLGQDPRRVPLGARPARRGPPAGDPQAPLPGALRLAAEGPRRRRRAQPAQPARPASGTRPAASALPEPDITVGVRSGDTPADERRRLRAQPARHPHHHARVAVPDAHLAGARGAARRRDGDHRRGARARRHQARRAPRPLARAPRRPARAARAAHRAVRHRAPGRGGRPLPRRPARPVDGRAAAVDQEGDLEVVVPVDDMAELGACPPASVERLACRPTTGVPRSGRTSRSASSTSSRAPLDLRLLQLAAPRRAAHRAAQRDLASSGSRPATELPRAAARAPAAGDGAVRRRGGAPAGARPRAPRLGVQGAARGSSRRTSRPGGSRPWSPRAASSSASTWARSTSSIQVESPPRWRPGCSASAAPATRWARSSRGCSSRSTAATSLQTAVVVERMRGGLDRVVAHAANPLDVLAQQIVAMFAL